MANPYMSELRVFSFNFPPKGWAFCNGQILTINQNQALYSLLGTTYGGNGQTTFALPNLQGKVAMHVGNGLALGQTGGEAGHTLLLNELPQHVHTLLASSNSPNANTPANNFWASNTGSSPYTASPTGIMAANAIGNTGGSQPHNNMSPYLALNICIALVGIYPSRN